MAEYNSAHTGAEIDAAVQKYKDGNIYQVTNADVYSTEETVVGQWIDGKPIYRRVIVRTTGSSAKTAHKLVKMSDFSIEHVLSCRGPIVLSAFNISALYPILDSSGNNNHGSIHVTEDGYLFERHVSASYNSLPIYVVIEYTKTTDEATIAIPTAAEMAAAYEEGVQSA